VDPSWECKVAFLRAHLALVSIYHQKHQRFTLKKNGSKGFMQLDKMLALSYNHCKYPIVSQKYFWLELKKPFQLSFQFSYPSIIFNGSWRWQVLGFRVWHFTRLAYFGLVVPLDVYRQYLRDLKVWGDWCFAFWCCCHFFGLVISLCAPIMKKVAMNIMKRF